MRKNKGDVLKLDSTTKQDLSYYIRKKCEEAYLQGWRLGRELGEETDDSPDASNNKTVKKIASILESQYELLSTTGNTDGAKILGVAINSVYKEMAVTENSHSEMCCGEGYEEVL